MRVKGLLIFAALSLSLAACDGIYPHTLGRADALVTKADVRVTSATPVPEGFDPVRGVRPLQVSCAEPSPDVAKALSEALNIGTAVDVAGVPADVPAEVKAQIAASIAHSRAEAMAQLTSRLPTIQLLRDGLFRLCEAYGNGAVNQMEYALVLSRIGETMVTMLSAELAAGNFGQQLATLGGSASGASAAILAQATKDAAKIQQDQQTVNDLTNQVDTAQKAVDGVEKQIVADPMNQALKIEHASAVSKLSNAQRKLNDAQVQLDADKRTAAQSAVTAMATPVGTLSDRKPDKDISATIAEMQNTYISSPNFNALMVACIMALERQPGTASVVTTKGETVLVTETLFARKCDQELMANMMVNAGKMVEAAVARTAARSTAFPVMAPALSTEDVKRYQTALKTLGFYNGAVDGKPGKQTRAALSAFQQNKKLPVTGMADAATLKALGVP